MKKINHKMILATIIIILLLLAINFSILILLEEKKQNEAIPVISLIGEENIKLELNQEYEENGAIANIDKQDLTGKIQKIGEVDISKTGRYEITYFVTNNRDKNKVEVKRTIDVIDTTAPEIKLNGNSEISMYIGSDYKEEGATATDNYDGDISENIVISGEVNNKELGDYTVKYYVQDSSANTAEITRKIIVKEKPVPKPTTTATTTTITKISGKGIPILMYHFFYDKNVSNGTDSNWLEISKFEEQMKYLSENNFYFPSWQEVADYVDGKINLPSKSVVITVDDGDPSFFDLAVPIIKKYNVKATSFVVSSWYARNAVKYKSENVDLQSHSHNMHRSATGGKGIFLSNTYEDAIQDIKTSQNKLGGSSVIAFAYPFGHYNDHAKKVLADANIKVAVTTQNGRAYKGSDRLALSRVRVYGGITLNAFKNMVN